MGVIKDSEIDRLVRELSDAWIGEQGDGVGVVDQVSSQPYSGDGPLSRDDRVGSALGGLPEAKVVLSLISASDRRQEFAGRLGADSALGLELTRRSR